MNIETVAYDSMPQSVSHNNGLVKMCYPPIGSAYSSYNGPLHHYTYSTAGEQVKAKLADHGITLGKKYGSTGITINNLVLQQPDESYYEVNALHLLNTSPLILKQLLKKHKLIIHDFIEGSKFIGEFVSTFKSMIVSAREIIWAGQMDQYACVNGTKLDAKNSIHVDAIIHGAATFYSANRITPTVDQADTIIIPARKPNYSRIKTLAMFDEAKLLDKANWSLFMQHTDSDDWDWNNNNWQHTPNVYAKPQEYNKDTQCVKFLEKYKNVLPKTLQGFSPTTFKDHLYLDNKWANAGWWVSIETYVDQIFVTEKTLKGFALGVPALTVAGKGYDTHLESLGFVMEKNLDYCATWQDRIAEIIEHIMEHPKGNKEIAMHNYNLLLDENFIISLIADPYIAFKEKVSTRQ